jgi:hypothetical protein
VLAGSGDLELLVAEVGDELEGAAEGGDVAVQDVLGGDVPAFDLGTCSRTIGMVVRFLAPVMGGRRALRAVAMCRHGVRPSLRCRRYE